MEDEGVAEFESGYTDDNAAEKPPVEEVAEVTPEPEVKEEIKEEVAETPKPDPLVEVLSRFDKMEHRLRNTEGHIGGLNHNLKQMQETLAASKAASQQVSDAPTQEQVKEAMANPKEWDELKSDFPEWASATEKFMDARLSKVPAVDETKIRELEQKLNNETATLRKESIDATLDAVLPDWDLEVKTPEFSKWMESQSDDVKALAASNSIRDAAKMLRLFSTHKARSVPEPKPSNVAARQKRIEAAVTPKGTGGFAPAPTELDEFESGYTTR